jgi:hypothetical protein
MLSGIPHQHFQPLHRRSSIGVHGLDIRGLGYCSVGMAQDALQISN